MSCSNCGYDHSHSHAHHHDHHHHGHHHHDFDDHHASGVQNKCLDLLLLGPRLLKAAASSTVEVLKDTFDYSKSCPVCEIPETDCPPHCVCVIDWYGAVGDVLHHKIEVTNTGKEKRTLELVPQNFSCTDKIISIVPTKKLLAPGESFLAEVTFTIPEGFAGSDYEADILLKGAYEQCIKLFLEVKSHHDASCHVKQGEIPKVIKAHHWFNHFQCEKPCAEALEVKP